MHVLYEDNHLIAINKQSGDIVQGDKTGDKTLGDDVKEYLKKKYNKPGEVFLGVVHRLDRPTSGVVIFAKTSKALARLNKMLHDKEMQKTYWAITSNRPPKEKDTLTHFLKKNELKNRSYVYDHNAKGSKQAILHYEIIAALKHNNLLEVKLETGRHHQIRAQLGHIGCPVRGDLKYRATRSNKDGSISLHARMLELEHPIKKEMLKIVAPVPDDNLWKEFMKTME